MLSYLTALTILLIGSGGALAGPRDDWQKLRGDAAIRACNQAIGQNPRDAQLYYKRGLEYGKKGDLDRELADYTKAIEFNQLRE